MGGVRAGGGEDLPPIPQDGQCRQGPGDPGRAHAAPLSRGLGSGREPAGRGGSGSLLCDGSSSSARGAAHPGEPRGCQGRAAAEAAGPAQGLQGARHRWLCRRERGSPELPCAMEPCSEQGLHGSVPARQQAVSPEQQLGFPVSQLQYLLLLFSKLCVCQRVPGLRGSS